MLLTQRSNPALFVLLAACGSQPADSADVMAGEPDIEDVGDSEDGQDSDTPGGDPDVLEVGPVDGPGTPDGPEDVSTQPDSDAVPDVVDVAPDVVDVAPDVVDVAPDVVDVAPDTPRDVSGDRCAPPVRMEPTRGPAAGGTRVEIYGSEWYIGALWWVAEFGDVQVDETYDDSSREECTLYFVTPPHAAGQVPVSVAYGARGPEIDMPFGTFTYE